MPVSKKKVETRDLKAMLRNADAKERAKASLAWPTSEDRAAIQQAAKNGNRKVILLSGTFSVEKCTHKVHDPEARGCVFVKAVDRNSPCGHFTY